MTATIRLRHVAGCCALVLAPALAAQTYPAKTIRVVVAFAPGGGTDILARAIAQKFTEAWGHSVVVDNRPGGNGNIGTELVARAAPDGYTLLATSSGPFVISPSLFPKLPYDAVRDFAPVTLGVTYAYLLVSHPSVPARTVRELVALARARPGRLTCGSGGIATPPHLITELFNLMAGVQIMHVPYKGTGAALIDVLGGHVDLLFGNLPSQLPHVRSGKLRPIGISTSRRSALLPAVPTIDEAGVPGFEANAWMGWFAPAGTPREIIQKLQGQIAAIMREADMKQRLVGEGAEPEGGTPEQFAEFIKADRAKWAKVIQGARIRPE
jgi:tripartite-type tricarboxylate transporter receptor subunit TctC